MNFFNAKSFLPRYSIEDFVKIYGILGGTPAYLREFDDNLSIEDNLLRYFTRSSFLYQDALFVLREELDEPRNYFALMKAIAKGKTTLGEIMNETGLDRATTGKYLSVLIDLDLIRREIPITASWKSRKGRYYVNEPYFSFWFRYVHPNLDLIETNQSEIMLKLVLNDFDQYLGGIFETIANDFLIELNKAGKLPFTIIKQGRWWQKDQEIDIVALNENKKIALFVEVKWKDLSTNDVNNILRTLRKKAELVGLDDWIKYYGVIGKSIQKKNKFKHERQLLWDLNDFKQFI